MSLYHAEAQSIRRRNEIIVTDWIEALKVGDIVLRCIGRTQEKATVIRITKAQIIVQVKQIDGTSIEEKYRKDGRGLVSQRKYMNPCGVFITKNTSGEA